MTIQEINIGTAPNDNTGDDPRTAGQKINSNFQSLLVRAAPKSLIINGDFSVNQREVSGVVTLTPGEYGHDRFKAGSSGCTYTFGSAGGITTINITAGTLTQIIETNNNPALTVSLSWAGTTQGRVNGGVYSDSGISETTIGGSNTIVEFNIGSLSHVQLEISDVATDFEFVHPDDQLARCKRYFERFGSIISDEIALGMAHGISTTIASGVISYSEKRGLPSISGSVTAGDFHIRDSSGLLIPSTFTSVFDTGYKSSGISVTRDSGTHVAGDTFILSLDNISTAYIDISAEL